MIKTIINTLIDSFCASMLVGFFALGIAFAVVPMVDPQSAIWLSVTSFPFFVIGSVFFMLLNRSEKNA